MADPLPTRSHWTERAPAMLLHADTDAHGQPCATPIDRRWLWRLESFLAINGTNDTLRGIGTDLRQYLNETCEHHWKHWPADDTFGEHRQCQWCSDVEWLGEQPGDPDREGAAA